MDFRDVKWSKKQCTLKEIAKTNQLPCIIRVVHGCSAETSDMDISKDEVFRLQQQIHERRVRACTSYREYSIPVHYGKMVKIIPKKKTSNKDTKPMYLTDLFDVEKKVKLPLIVEFVRMSPILEEPGVRPIIEGPFNLEKLLKKNYILGNRISSDSIDSEVVILPVDLETEVKIAEGLQNGSKSEWAELMQELDSIREKVNFDLHRGIKEVFSKPIHTGTRPRVQSVCSVTTLPKTNPRGTPTRRLSEPVYKSSAPTAYRRKPIDRPTNRPTDRPMSRPIDPRGLDVAMSHGINNHYEPPPPYSPINPMIEHQRPGAPQHHPFRFIEPTARESLDRNSNLQPSCTSSSSSRKESPKTRNSWSCLPDRIDDFSVADVCTSLKLLGIHNYYEIFKEKNINGAKLKTYNLDKMTKELKMRPRDALTLDTLIENGKPADAPN